MRQLRRGLCILLALVMALGLTVVSFAASETDVDSALRDTAAFVRRTVPDPTVGSTGGEWSIIGLARSGEDVPQSYYDTYYKNLCAYVRERDGELHAYKYTEYSRVILALTAIGKDPHDVAGYDLVEPLGDFDKTVYQGINGAIFALIALDSGGYDMPVNSGAQVQATREMYVDYILSREERGGGWALVRGRGDDADITGMALQALSRYTGRADVRAAVDRALARLSEMQNSDGSFAASASFGATGANCESTVQVIVALTELGVSLDDSRFVKNGRTALDALLTFYTPGSGFVHTGSGSGVGGMATEQGLYALAAAKRAMSGMNTLYDMTPEKGDAPGPDVPDVSFSDVPESAWFYEDVAFAVHKELFNGVGGGKFDPDGSMSRAMLVTVLWRLDGKPTPRGTGSFSDLKAGQYYTEAVLWASENQIVNGVGGSRFDPDGDVTREQIAAILMRYADYKGYDTSASNSLAGYADAGSVSSFAASAMAWANAEGIINGRTADTLAPAGNAKRCEVAKMMRVFYENVAR